MKVLSIPRREDKNVMVMTMQRPTAAEDDALIERARSGDADALDTLLQRHAATAVAICFSLTGNRADALDAAQNALFNVAREVRSNWRGKPFKLCLHTHARHAALKLRQQNAARLRRDRAAASRTEAVMSAVSHEKTEAIEAMREELAELPELTGAALTLHHLEELPVAEVAAQTGLSLDACKQRLSRGREELRHRLEKRGVVLGAAVATGMLDEVFAAGRAFAAELSPAELAGLSHNAAHGESASSAQDSAPPESNAEPDGVRGGAQRAPFKAMAFIAIGLLLAAMIPLVTPPAPAQLPPAKTTAVATASPSVPVAPKPARWQTPRFMDVQGQPESVSASGAHAAIVLKDGDTLTLLESSNGGESWKTGVSLKGYGSGQLTLAEDGGCLLLGIVAETQKKSAMFGLLDNSTTRNVRIEWMRRGAAGEFGAARELWSCDALQTFSEVQLYPGAKGVWAAAEVSNVDRKPGRSVRLAYFPAGGEPREIPTQSTDWTSTSTGFTFEENGFGMVCTRGMGALACFLTRDEGATWTQHSVPLDENPDSGQRIFFCDPLSARRTGSKVAILLKRVTIPTQAPPTPDILEKMKQQKFVVVSGDLCKTWSEPRPVSAAVPYISLSLLEGRYWLHTLEDNWVVCRHQVKATIIPMGPALTPTRINISASAFISSDDGQTWNNFHAFDALGERAHWYASGGDGRTLHAAFNVRGEKKGDPPFAVRSFGAGEWRTPTQSPPAWFKEEKLPEPTREDF